jgi:hypothetical protein
VSQITNGIVKRHKSVVAIVPEEAYSLSEPLISAKIGKAMPEGVAKSTTNIASMSPESIPVFPTKI